MYIYIDYIYIERDVHICTYIHIYIQLRCATIRHRSYSKQARFQANLSVHRVSSIAKKNKNLKPVARENARNSILCMLFSRLGGHFWMLLGAS